MNVTTRILHAAALSSLLAACHVEVVGTQSTVIDDRREGDADKAACACPYTTTSTIVVIEDGCLYAQTQKQCEAASCFVSIDGSGTRRVPCKVLPPPPPDMLPPDMPPPDMPPPDMPPPDMPPLDMPPPDIQEPIDFGERSDLIITPLDLPPSLGFEMKLYSIRHQGDYAVRRDIIRSNGLTADWKTFGLGPVDTVLVNNYWDYLDYLNDGATDPGDNQFPVLYKFDDRVSVERVRFSYEGVPPEPANVASWTIQGTFPDGSKTAAVPARWIGPRDDMKKTQRYFVEATMTRAQGTSAERLRAVDYHPNYRIEWKLSVTFNDQTPPRAFAGTSQSRIYTALSPSSVAERFESVVHRSCTNASGLDDTASSAQRFDKIWIDFQPTPIGGFPHPNVRSVDEDGYNNVVDVEMDYWHTTNVSSGLLGDYSGTCSDWSWFLVDTVGLQGVTATTNHLTPATPLLTLIPQFLLPDGPAFAIPDGQGHNANHPVGFSMHCVVTFSRGSVQWVYDPSYGLNIGPQLAPLKSAKENYRDTFVRAPGALAVPIGLGWGGDCPRGDL